MNLEKLKMLKVVKQNKIIFIVAALLFQISILTFICCNSTRIEKKALADNKNLLAFECTIYDPFDAFKGHYMEINLVEENKLYEELDETSASYKSLGLEPKDVICIFENDANGITHIKAIRLADDKKNILDDTSLRFVNAKAVFHEEYVKITFDFGKYFLNEELSFYADKITSLEFNSLNPLLELYYDGKGAVIQKALSFYLNDEKKRITIEDYIKNYKMKNKD